MFDWLEENLEIVVEASRLHVSTIKPSEWYEQRMIMPPGSAFPGPFNYNRTPYWREVADCAAKDHPAKEISIMKGAQSGGTAAVLNPIVGYTIDLNPGNIMYLTGHSDLSEQAVLKIDQMIDGTGLRPKIRPNVLRAKNSRSGDTNKSKEFPGGILNAGSVTNHNLLRQYDVMIMIVDDFDAAKQSSKKSGSTRALVQKRTSAFAYKKKIIYCSSPELLGASNIHDVFLKGDQRYYNVPCPCCGSYIVLKWRIDVDDKETAGIRWNVKNGKLDRTSVGYVCQNCGGFFKESHKYEMNLAGFWQPTAIAQEDNHYSYHLSSLYSPPGMDDWAHYVQQFINANPEGAPRKEEEYQTFVNIVLGEPYEQTGEAPKANELQVNCRRYEIGVVPEKLSLADGNGKILLLTLAADCNGTEHDARVDYEVIGWAESGASYSIKHGSIGTFIYKETDEQKKIYREKWSYHAKREQNVWTELNKILAEKFVVDTGRKMPIGFSGIDCGYHSEFVYSYLDRSNFSTVGLKGKGIDKFVRFDDDLATYKRAKERVNLFLLEVNRVKDHLAEFIKLKWDANYESKQPSGFMNFPLPSGGLYMYENYFRHFENEHKVTQNKDGKTVAARWIKKASNLENHFWDVRVYNMVVKEIFIEMFGKALKEKNFTWADYCRVMTTRK